MFRTTLCACSIVAAAILGLAVPAAYSATLTSGDLIVVTNSFCCNGGPTPNVYQLDSTGNFKGWFFSPISATDIAINKSGQILFASSNSGTIIATDTSGAFQGFVTTPVPQITGLAVEANGNIIAADHNEIFQLDPTGKFLNLTFSSTDINSSIGVDPQGDLVFPIPGQCCSGLASLGFLNLNSRVVTKVPTTLATIGALDVDESGNVFAVGSTTFFSNANSIFELDSSGNVLQQFAGPQNLAAIAVANLPEPGTAVLLSAGLSMLSVCGRRRAQSR